MNKYNLFFASVLAASSLASGQVWASSDNCQREEYNYQQCDNQVGWYLGADIGFADTNVSQTDVDRFFQQSNLAANSIAVDDNDSTWSAFVGYQFNTYFALELGYLDLGERSVDFTGSSTDRDAFFDSVEHIYPQSAEGATINLVGSYPLTERLKLSGKLGYFDWRGNYRTNEGNNQVGRDRISDQDLWYGVELNYRLADHWQAYGSFSRVKLSRDKNNVIALGIRYYFGGDSNSQPVAEIASQPAPAATPVLVPEPVAEAVKPVDSDADGVIDSLDNCADSDSRYQVDAKGCTLMAEQLAEFNLVVRYANDSAEIAPEYFTKIAELADFVNTYKVKQLTVTGHTSAPGRKAYNQTLSERRAQSVAAMLSEQYDIDAKIINPVGQGENQLLDKAYNEQAHQLNRRIEISLKERLILPVEK